MTKRFHIKDKNDNVVGIRVETAKETFVIPVVDVRVDRKRVEAFEARNKRESKFFKPSYSLFGYRY